MDIGGGVGGGHSFKMKHIHKSIYLKRIERFMVMMRNDFKRIQNHHSNDTCSKKHTTWYMDNPNFGGVLNI